MREESTPAWFVVFMTLVVVLVIWVFYNLGRADGECAGYCIRAGEHVAECTVQKVTCADKPSWAPEDPVER